MSSSLTRIDRNELLFTAFDASRCGYFEFIKTAFDEYISDINITNELGQNCLMICCEFNQIEIFKYLISKKHINYLLCDTENNWNCLHYALKYGNFRIAQILLNKASTTQFPKYFNDSNGYNPFDLLPPNLYKKELYDDIYNQSNKRIKRKIYNASFPHILQKGHCQRIYGDENKKIVSNLQVQGVLYSWGLNDNDQLGLNNNNSHRSTPKLVKPLRNISIIDIACSGYHSIAITDTGNVYVFGNNSDGRLGLGYMSNEYNPYIKKPRLLKIKGENDKSMHFMSCTATLDHSTLLTSGGDVYVFGCDRNSEIVKYTKKMMNLPWTKRIEPFCITNNNKYNNMRYVSSSFERIIMIGMDNKLYFIGKSFNGNKINIPTIINTSNSEIKKIGIQSACIGDNFLVVLLLNGVLLSRNKNKDQKKGKGKGGGGGTSGDHMNFSEIRLNKQFKFRQYHNKRESVEMQYITCYNGDGYGRCIAVATNNDIYEWKAPSTDAYYIGNINGIMDISCGPKMCIICNDMGEVYGFGDNQILGLSSKDKKLLKLNKKIYDIGGRDDGKNKGKGGGGGGMKKHANIERIVTLSQIGKVFATKNSVFVIQSFLWPDRNLLNAKHHHQQMKQMRNKKIERKFWNEHLFKNMSGDIDVNLDEPFHSQTNEDLYDCYNMFAALSLDIDEKEEDEEEEEEKKSNNRRKHRRSHRNKKGKKQNHKNSNKSRSNLKALVTDKKEYKNIDRKPLDIGLDEDDDRSSVPSLVAYCEDILIHQIDIQTVISLYKQSYSMGFHRISVFLSFVIIENIQHLLYFLLRDCSEDEVLFVEQLFKNKYYPQTNINHIKYYCSSEFYKDKKRIIEQYRILPKNYPNYKTELANINKTLQKIQIVEEKVDKLIIKYQQEIEYKNDDERHNDDEDAEIIYFDSNEEELDENIDEFDEDKLFSQFNETPMDRALNALNSKERILYESKQQILGERNRILFQIANPEQFPSLQMMQKWKRKQKKKNRYNTFIDKSDDKKNKKNKKIKDDDSFLGIGIASSYDADQYLKHVYLKQTHSEYQHEVKEQTGFIFTFDYDQYNKPKSKQHSKAIIYRKFDVKDVMHKDAKRATKMTKKQEKKKMQKKQHKNKQNKSQQQLHSVGNNNQNQSQNIKSGGSGSSAARRRRKRKKNNTQNIQNIQSPKSKPQNNNLQKGGKIKSIVSPKLTANNTSSSPKMTANTRFKYNQKSSPQITATTPHSPSPQIQQRITPTSPNILHQQQQQQSIESSVLSPIEVVRRNREKKLLEEELNNFKNDVWDLSVKEEEEKKIKHETSGSLSDILNAQKNQYENEKKKKRHEKYIQYKETQNAWSQQTKEENTKSIRPQATNKNQHKKKKKENERDSSHQPSIIERAQEEELQFRSLVQHEHEWMIDAPQVIDNKNDDYDAFVKQQELLLKSFQNEQQQQQQVMDDSFNNNREYSNNRNWRGRSGGYGNRGNRGRGTYGYNTRYDNEYNDNNYNNNRDRERDRGRGRGYNNRGNRRYDNDYNYNNNNDGGYRGRGRGRGGYRGRYQKQYNNDNYSYYRGGRGRDRGYNDNYGGRGRGRGYGRDRNRYNNDYNNNNNNDNQQSSNNEWRKK